MIKQAIAAVAAVVMFLAGQPAGAASPRGITCSVQGAAKLEPGVNSSDRKFDISFTGELSDCRGSGGEASGTATATATAEGNCGYSATSGRATIGWENHTETKATFTTEDAAAFILLRARVTDSSARSLQRGDEFVAVLVFQADPSECETKKGITRAEFSGRIGGGSPN